MKSTKDRDPSRVFIFALSTSASCQATKKLFDSLGQPFDQIEVDLLSADERNAALAEMTKYNPAQTFPTVLAGSRVIVGFLADDLRQAVGRMKRRR